MAAWWRNTLPHFQDHDVQAIELPGFGNNRSPLPLDLNGYARALLTQCDSRSVIVACGIGALVVLRACTMRPAYFRNIILLAPIGAFLWRRKLARWLSIPVFAAMARFLLSYCIELFQPMLAVHAGQKPSLKLLSQGYRHCRAFPRMCRIIRSADALQLLDSLRENVHIVWGKQDKIANPRHAAAWEAILCRSRLSISMPEHWGHYPYIDDGQAFADTIESITKQDGGIGSTIYNAHSKGGRLQLAQHTEIKTPAFWLASLHNLEETIARLPTHRIFRWAVRGSSYQEDQYDHSFAGQSSSYISISIADVKAFAELVLQTCEQVIIQEYISVKTSGVAFVRSQSIELEWLNSRHDTVTAGRRTPHQLSLSWPFKCASLSNGTNSEPEFDLGECITFLRDISLKFHFMPVDIEWGWNGRHFFLFQVRPISVFSWKRLLSSANIDELLPDQPSMLMEQTQRLASYAIPQIYALWDKRILELNEPFTATYNDASYLNLDIYLYCLHQWGLPSRLLSKNIGAPVPNTVFNLIRLFKSVPVFFRMLLNSRRAIRLIKTNIKAFNCDLTDIENLAVSQQLAALQAWFLRLYVYVVQTNLLLNAAIMSSLGNWTGRNMQAYAGFNGEHRVNYESDPASPRTTAQNDAPLFQSYRKLPRTLDRLFDALLLPGNQAYFIEQREIFRDTYTRLYFRLHILVKKLDHDGLLFSPYLNPRELSGSFWQHNGQPLCHNALYDENSTGVQVIYPGKVSGVVDKDILIVDRLDPGKFKHYRGFKAIIARGGGYLSHAAILLRELRIPSAFIPDMPELLPGTQLEFNNGDLHY